MAEFELPPAELPPALCVVDTRRGPTHFAALSYFAHGSGSGGMAGSCVRHLGFEHSGPSENGENVINTSPQAHCHTV